MTSNGGAPYDPAWEARSLLRAARGATLATQDDGQPYAALVTPAVLPDASVLLLLSGLSEHTKHLRRDPRCALMVLGAATGPNPQTAPRLTVFGRAAPEHDPALKERWLHIHPYAGFYAGLPDFTLWRVQPTGGHFIGGFARAGRIPLASLQPDPAALAAISHAAASVVAHCNDDHPEALDAIAGSASGAGWRMVGVDTDGFDLARGEDVLRVAWSAPVSDAMQIRAELVRLAHAARAAEPTPAQPPGS